MAQETTGFVSAVEAKFLNKRYGIISCSSTIDLDIADAKYQLMKWKERGGVLQNEKTVTTLVYKQCAPAEINYCLA